MPSTIDTVSVTKFTDTVHANAQQKSSRSMSCVQVEKMSGQAWAYDGFGTLDAVEITGRSQDVVHADAEWLRRQVIKRRFAVAVAVDEADVRNMLISPTSTLAKACVYALNRRVDKLIMTSAFADVKTGNDFSSIVTFLADGGSTIDATGGLTYAKLLAAKQKFLDNDVGNEMEEKLCFFGSGDEHTALLNEDKFINADYTATKSAHPGKVTEAVGINFTFFAGNAKNPIINVTAGGVRENVLMSTRGIVVGLSEQIQVSVQPRNDKYETSQVVAINELGATRTEGVLVQKIQTTD